MNHYLKSLNASEPVGPARHFCRQIKAIGSRHIDGFVCLSQKHVNFLLELRLDFLGMRPRQSRMFAGIGLHLCTVHSNAAETGDAHLAGNDKHAQE